MNEDEDLISFNFEKENNINDKIDKISGFLINGLKLIKFDDLVETEIKIISTEILSKLTNYGYKFYVKISSNDDEYYWQLSPTTLKKLSEHFEDFEKKIFLITLDVENKIYNIKVKN